MNGPIKVVERKVKKNTMIKAEWDVLHYGEKIGIVENGRNATEEPFTYNVVAMDHDKKAAHSFGPFPLTLEGFGEAIGQIVAWNQSR